MRVHSSPRTAALESSPLWATPHARRAVERAWSDPTVHRSVYVQRHCVQTHYARARRARVYVFFLRIPPWRQGSGLKFLL